MFNIGDNKDRPLSQGPIQLIEVPTLLIWVRRRGECIIFMCILQGENDAFLDVSLSQGHQSVCSDITVRLD